MATLTGYRALTEAEVGLMNEGKALAEQVGAFVEKVRDLPVTDALAPQSDAHDPRWAAIGATQLQQGFMALMRSIARPGTF